MGSRCSKDGLAVILGWIAPKLALQIVIGSPIRIGPTLWFGSPPLVYSEYKEEGANHDHPEQVPITTDQALRTEIGGLYHTVY